MNYVPNTGSHDDLANSTIREEFEVETINLESARVFRQYGGIEVNFNFNLKIIMLLESLMLFSKFKKQKIFKRILLLNLLIVDNNTNTTSTNFAANFSNNFSLLNSSNVSASTSSYSSSYLNQTTPNSLEHSHSYFRNSQPNERNSLRFFTNSKFENNNNKNSFINNYVEKCDILKIKCKCIQILNRLVCLVS